MDNRSTPAGRYFSARNLHGHYRSAGTTARYIFASPDLESSLAEFLDLLKSALWKNVERHPSLCIGVTDETPSSEAQFFRHEKIEWDDIVEVLPETLPEESEDIALSKQLGMGHQHIWKDAYTKPSWKILVLPHGYQTSSRSRTIDIAFLSNHAIADGLSNVAFHRSLCEYLYKASSLSNLVTTWPIRIPATVNPPVPIEQFITIPSDSSDLSDASDFSPWTGPAPSLDPYTSRCTILTIPETSLTHILKRCKDNSITLAGLLHAYITIHLARSLPQASALLATTPYSMRRFTKTSNHEMVNHVSICMSSFSSSIITEIRASEHGGEAEWKVVRMIAAQFQRDLKKDLETIEKEGSTEALTGIAKIKDFDEYCIGQIKKGKRGGSYEISNLGLTDMPNPDESEEYVKLRLEKLIFSQSGMVAGSVMSLNIVTLKNGPMVLTITWQGESLEEEFVERLKGHLERRLLNLEGMRK
ncbi:hypothetical protein B7494_g6838 [Chlorociboria aeruginascens]|nr:hypothetical protein B7494_g6838 [Chlorociboria aeruginascens]